MWCLTLATNAVVTWTTEYHGLAVTALRRPGGTSTAPRWPTSGPPSPERPILRHPLLRFDGELAELDSDGYRPLRALGPTGPVTWP